MMRKFAVALLGLLVLVLAGWFLLAGDRGEPVSSGVVGAGSMGAPAAAVSVRTPSSSASSRQGAQPHRPALPQPDDAGFVPIPARYQFAGVRRVRTGTDFEDWMEQFSLSDQETLRSFDKAFLGVYQGRTAAETTWMAAHGYPMPEDVLAAQGMSTEELRSLADQGNTKAAYFLRIRAKEDMMRLAAAGLPEAGAPGSDAAQFVATLKPVKKSGSPFKAYLTAWSMMPGYTGRSEDMVIIANLQWAAFLGDHDALERIDAFVDAAPNLEEKKYRRAMAVSAGWLRMSIHDSMRHRGLPEYCRAMISGVPGSYPVQVTGRNVE